MTMTGIADFDLALSDLDAVATTGVGYVCPDCAERYRIDRDPRGPHIARMRPALCAVCERWLPRGRMPLTQLAYVVCQYDIGRAKAKRANPTTCQGKALERCQPAWRRCET